MNYIDFFEREVPNWMRENNQKMQEVGFNTYEYWQWVAESIAAIRDRYNNDRFVLDQFDIIWKLLDSKTKELK